MDYFADRLVTAVRQKCNPVCVGLDPRLDLLPARLREEALARHGATPEGAAEALWEFNRRVIAVVAPLVPVVKVQVAFYERYGWAGYRVYERTVEAAKKAGLVVIGDVKRNDIGETVEAYCDGHLAGPEIGGRRFADATADAVTISPYLGSDTVQVFAERAHAAGKGVFVLIKTSNPGSSTLQDLITSRGEAYLRVADWVEDFSERFRAACGWSNVGAVVGATYPEEAAKLRRLLPNTPFLIPGYGAQGARARDAAAGFNTRGEGAVVNSSRGIIHAYAAGPLQKEFGEARWEEAVRRATEDMATELKQVLGARET